MKYIVTLLICLLFLTACAQEESIKIGFAAPLTGDLSNYGKPAQNTVMMAAEEINAEGGVNGVPIDIIYEDSKCNGKEAVNAVTKLVSVNNVKAIVGPLCSSAVIPSYPVAEEARVIMISFASSNPTLTFDTPYFFRTFPSDALQGKVGAEETLEEGHKRIAVLHSNDEYGIGFRDVYIENIEAGGGEIVAKEAYTPGDVDFRTQVQKLKETDPDLIYLIVFPKEGSLILKQLEEAGIKKPLMGGEVLFDPTLIENAAGAAEGLKITFPKGGEGPVFDAYQSNYMAKYGDEPAAYSSEGYDALKILVNSMRKCGTEGSQIKSCLESMGSYEGVSGTIEFDEYGDTQKEYDIFEVRDGEFVKI